VAALSAADAIGLDAERASGFRYSHKAYLIQIAIADNGIWIVDPLQTLEDMPLLAKAMHDKVWLLHAATQDLPCLAELGIRPTKIVDTELGARLAGQEKVGLGSLCESLLDLKLAKEHSAADWSKRPIPQEMLDYAALDVDVMFELWEAIASLLEEQGKSEWAKQEFEHLVGFEPKPAHPEPWRNLPGMARVRDLNKLKIAANLHSVRDQLAMEQDIAPGRLIPDRSIAAAALQAPESKSALVANKEFQGRASRTLINTWWEAIQQSQHLEIKLDSDHKGNGIPNHKSWEKRFPQAHQRLEVVRPLVVAKAQELGLPVENLLTPDTLRRVVFEPDADLERQLLDLGARSWQVEITLPLIRSGLVAASSLPAV
jgi:ribonuclease D